MNFGIIVNATDFPGRQEIFSKTRTHYQQLSPNTARKIIRSPMFTISFASRSAAHISSQPNSFRNANKSSEFLSPSQFKSARQGLMNAISGKVYNRVLVSVQSGLEAVNVAEIY